jgi:hypothetical protein
MQKIIMVAMFGFLITAQFPARVTRAQQNSQAPPAPQASDTFTIPAGTTIQAELTTILSSKGSKSGDPFSARVVEPVFGHGEAIVPEGSTLEGHVSFVKNPGRVKGAAEMRLVAESLTTSAGVKYDISAGLQDARGVGGVKVNGDEGTIQGPGKSKKEGAKDTGIGAGVGAGVGGIADGGTGALYGAAIGAVAGIARSLIKRHKDVVLPQGTELTFVIARATTAKKMAKPLDAPAQ